MAMGLLEHFGQLRQGYRQALVETRSLKERRGLAAKLELLDELEVWVEANDVARTESVRENGSQQA